MLRADIVGFHTFDYCRHFVSSCTRILGYEGTPDGVEDNGSITRVLSLPIGITPERFHSALVDEQVMVSLMLRRWGLLAGPSLPCVPG